VDDPADEHRTHEDTAVRRRGMRQSDEKCDVGMSAFSHDGVFSKKVLVADRGYT
jgi:hypothetical protein